MSVIDPTRLNHVNARWQAEKKISGKDVDWLLGLVRQFQADDYRKASDPLRGALDGLFGRGGL